MEVAADRIPAGAVVRQARVGDRFDPQCGDAGEGCHSLDRVGVDRRIPAAGQDRVVG